MFGSEQKWSERHGPLLVVHLCENIKGKVSQKVVINLKWSSLSSEWSFIQEYEGTGFGKSGLKRTSFRKSGLKGTGFGKVVMKEGQSLIRVVFYTGI